MKKAIFFPIFFLIVSCQKDQTKTIAFKDCKVEYMSYGNGKKEIYEGHTITNQCELESAKRQLGLCLCEKYMEKPDPQIKAKILELYNSAEECFSKDYPENLSFDTILKKRVEIFDSKILID